MDIVKVEKDEFFPADLLSSCYDDAICYVETMNQALELPHSYMRTVTSLILRLLLNAKTPMQICNLLLEVWISKSNGIPSPQQLLLHLWHKRLFKIQLILLQREAKLRRRWTELSNSFFSVLFLMAFQLKMTLKMGGRKGGIWDEMISTVLFHPHLIFIWGLGISEVIWDQISGWIFCFAVMFFLMFNRLKKIRVGCCLIWVVLVFNIWLKKSEKSNLN